MASPAPEGKRSFRLGRVLLATAIVSLLLVAITLLFRTAIATWAARSYLESEGVVVSSLEVTELSTDFVELNDIALGDDREVTIVWLRLEPSLFSAKRPIQTVSIQGMELHLDVTGKKPVFGSLQTLVDRLTAEESPGSASDKGGAADQDGEAALPDIAFRESRVVIETPSGPMTADLEGTFGEGPDGTLQGNTTLTLDSELGRLQARLDARRGADGALQLDASIAEGRFAWQGFALGTVNGRLAVAQAVGETPRIEADLDLRDLAYTPPGAPALHLDIGHLSISGSPADTTMELVLDGENEHLDLAVSAQLAEKQRVTMSLQSELRTAGGLAPFLPLPGPKVTAGTLVVQAEGDGILPDDPLAAATWADLLRLLAESRLDLQVDTILGGLALADGTSGVSAHLPLTTVFSENTLTLTLREDAAVRIENPARDSLAELGVPADLLPLVASGLNLTLKAGGDLPFKALSAPVWPPREAAVAVAAQATSDQGLRLSADSEGNATLGEALDLTAYDGRLDARAEADLLAIGGREARGVSVALPLDVGYGTQGLHLGLTRPGSLGIRQFGAGAPLRLQNPLSLEVTELVLDATPDAGGYQYRLKAQEDGAALAITAADADPVPITAKAISVALSGSFSPEAGHNADIDLRLNGFALPGYDFTAASAEVTLALDRELRPEASRFRLAPFQLGGEDPLTAPLSLTGDLKRAGGGYDVTGELGLSEGRVLADLSGRYTDDGTASVKAVSRLISFAPDALQPRDISPLLGELEEVRGGLTASAQLAWPRNPAAESGRITLSQLDFTGQGVTVSGLDLDLTLESLQPLTSAPAQQLTVAGLEAGVPVENIGVTFSLDQSPGPQLTLQDGGFDLAGARWQIEPLRFDPAAERNQVVLNTEALDLATFFELIEIDGLSGRGTLAGRLPVVLAGEDIIVEDGRFEAKGPGRLSIRFQALSSALAGGGETVELAAKALEDFRFEELTLDLAKTADNDATVKLSTLGANPEVLDGQPFRFNINLESNLTSVLEALQQGLSLSDDALKRAWQLRE
jgi:hypothetical protein